MHESLSPALNIWMGDKLIAVLPDSPRFGRPVEEGFAFLALEDGSRWRLLTRFDAPTGLWLRVGIELGEARRAMLGILGQAMLPLLIVLPLTVLLLYFGVGAACAAGEPGPPDCQAQPGPAGSGVHGRGAGRGQGVVAALNRLLRRLAMRWRASSVSRPTPPTNWSPPWRRSRPSYRSASAGCNRMPTGPCWIVSPRGSTGPATRWNSC